MNNLLSLIDNEIENCTARLAADTIQFVNIKSVKSEPMPGAPFGEGVEKMLNTFLEVAKTDGFFCTDYDVGVVSAAMDEGEIDLGIWLHGDVVAEGDGWKFPPYDATEYKGCIIGRGATDNKGQLAAVLNLFRIFKKLGVKLNYNPAIYLGSNEENGKHDITGVEGNPDARGFLNVHKPPKLSLVPDGGFPVGYGGKGSAIVTLRSKRPIEGYTFVAGQTNSPGLAVAQFFSTEIPESVEGCTVSRGACNEISAFSPPVHGAHPDPNGNMITFLSRALLDYDLVPSGDRRMFEFLHDVSKMIYGEPLGIATEHEIMGKLTVTARSVGCEDGYLTFTISSRYPIGMTLDMIRESIDEHAAEYGFEVIDAYSYTRPYINERDNEVVRTLCKASSDVIGKDLPPYTLSGGTYAHELPNAYVFGTDGNLPPEDFPKGRGGAHGIDEAVSLERLKRAMRIYARALLSLNDIRW